MYVIIALLWLYLYCCLGNVRCAVCRFAWLVCTRCTKNQRLKTYLQQIIQFGQLVSTFIRTLYTLHTQRDIHVHVHVFLPQENQIHSNWMVHSSFFVEAPNLYLLPFNVHMPHFFSLSSSKVKRMTYNRIFFVYIFFVERFFIVCCCCSHRWLVQWYWDFSRLLFDYPYLFAYSITVEYWRLQRKHIKLPIYLLFLLLFFCFARNSNWTHFCVFGIAKLYIWSFAKINYNECHMHWIVYPLCSMYTFSLCIDWKHYNLSHLFSNHAINNNKKEARDFCWYCCVFYCYYCCYFAQVMIGTARIARSWGSRVKVDSKVIINFYNNWTFHPKKTIDLWLILRELVRISHADVVRLLHFDTFRLYVICEEFDYYSNKFASFKSIQISKIKWTEKRSK